MLVTWNGFNRPTPTKGEGALRNIIPHGWSMHSEGLFFILRHN